LKAAIESHYVLSDRLQFLLKGELASKISRDDEMLQGLILDKKTDHNFTCKPLQFRGSFPETTVF
jgi:hypothetical protein